MSLDWLQRRWASNSHNLMPFLLVSLLLHGAAFLYLFIYWHPSENDKLQIQSSLLPVKFIDLPPDKLAVAPPNPKYFASSNSTSGGKARAELPVAARTQIKSTLSLIPSNQSPSTPAPSQPISISPSFTPSILNQPSSTASSSQAEQPSNPIASKNQTAESPEEFSISSKPLTLNLQPTDNPPIKPKLSESLPLASPKSTVTKQIENFTTNRLALNLQPKSNLPVAKPKSSARPQSVPPVARNTEDFTANRIALDLLPKNIIAAPKPKSSAHPQSVAKNTENFTANRIGLDLLPKNIVAASKPKSSESPPVKPVAKSTENFTANRVGLDLLPKNIIAAPKPKSSESAPLPNSPNRSIAAQVTTPDRLAINLPISMPVVPTQPKKPKPQQTSTVKRLTKPKQQTSTIKRSTPTANRLAVNSSSSNPTKPKQNSDDLPKWHQANSLGGPVSLNDRNFSSGDDQIANPNRSALNPGSVDARQDNNFRPYLDSVKQKVTREWSSQELDSLRRTTIVGFSISPNGQLINLHIIKRSGSQRIDQAALDAVEKAAPFAPLPEGFTASYDGITFTFNVIYGELRLKS